MKGILGTCDIERRRMCHGPVGTKAFEQLSRLVPHCEWIGILRDVPDQNRWLGVRLKLTTAREQEGEPRQFLISLQ